MIFIDGILLQTDVMQILRELKYQLAINNIYLFSTIKDTNDNIMVTCPIHKNGQEKSPSCGIHKKTGVVHCFTCGYAVSLSEMISNVFGRDDFGIFGKEWLRKNFTEVAVEARQDTKLDMSRNQTSEAIQYVSEEELDSYRYYHPYFAKRGISDDVIDKYDLGYDAKSDCVTFPVRDETGGCLFVARRSIKDKWFNYPSGAHKTVYGKYEIDNDSDIVYVCESMFNALSLATLGYQAVALNGTGSKTQFDELCKLKNRRIALALDNDDAGNKGRDRIANKIKNCKILYTVDYPDSRDINDLLLDGELEKLVGTTHLYFV